MIIALSVRCCIQIYSGLSLEGCNSRCIKQCFALGCCLLLKYNRISDFIMTNTSQNNCGRRCFLCSKIYKHWFDFSHLGQRRKIGGPSLRIATELTCKDRYLHALVYVHCCYSCYSNPMYACTKLWLGISSACCKCFAVFREALAAWSGVSNLVILGSRTARRLPIFSFLVRHVESGLFLHYNYTSALLNDLFGITVAWRLRLCGSLCTGQWTNVNMHGITKGIWTTSVISD